ncbi:hypothetical protein ACFQU2_23160 [Siccirubricoccus deserti]
MLKDACPPGQMGKVFGFVSSSLPLGSAIVPVPMGFLIDMGYPWLVLPVVAGLLGLSLLCAGGARGVRADSRPRGWWQRNRVTPVSVAGCRSLAWIAVPWHGTG